MAATEPLCHLIGIDSYKLSREEFLILEAELFYSVCEELKEIFRMQYKEYFRLTKLTKEMENIMLEHHFLRFIINDTLSTKEYSVEGFAYYIDTHADVVNEIISGNNVNPSAMLLRRAIGLHRSVRGELYQAIIQKIIKKYLVAN